MPWLDPLALGWLSDGERENLQRLITTEEVLKAIGSFPAGKSPGPNGLPIEFYMTHGDLLAPKLAQLYSHCPAEGALPTSMGHAHVILIHKAPKDPNSCTSYRSIALLNTDFKILTKLLTMRIQPLLPSLIETDQNLSLWPSLPLRWHLRRPLAHPYTLRDCVLDGWRRG